VKLNIVILLCFSFIAFGCKTFISANGKRHVQLFPVRLKQNRHELDTSKYITQKFSRSNFKNKIVKQNNKKIFELITSADIASLKLEEDDIYIVFWNPQCPASIKEIRLSDSIIKAGENVILLSLFNNYDLIDKRLTRHMMYNCPYYIMANNNESTVLKAKIKFIKESCEHCYQKYKDEVATIDYLLIQKGHIEGKMINNRTVK